MAQAWHYERSGQRFGPISTNELKAKVGAGELSPTDLIWREGMKDWKPARFAKGLFPEVVSGASDLNENPVVNASEIKEKRPITNQSSGAVIDHTTIAPEKFSFKETAIAAAKLGAAQAERAKLLNVTLPQQYLVLGRYCLTASDIQADFNEPILKLNQIQSEITRLKDHEASKASSISEKARAAADYAVRSAHRAKLTFEHSSLLSTLGKAVYDKHGVSGGPENVTALVQASLSRIESLDDQINTLSQSKSKSWLTPSRLLIAALVLLALSGFWGWRTIISHRNNAIIATVEVPAQAPAEEKPDRPEQDNEEVSISSGDDIAKFASKKFPPNYFEKGPNGEEVVVEQASGFPKRYYLDSTGKRFYHGITKDEVPYAYKFKAGKYNQTRYLLFDKSILVASIEVNETGKPNYVFRKCDDKYVKDIYNYDGDEVIHLRMDCRLEGDETILISNPIRVDNPPLQNVRGRSLPINVSSAGIAKKHILVERFFNPSIRNPKCGIEKDSLDVAFDIDISKLHEAGGGMAGPPRQFGLLFRIFDESGNYITHFHTRERFCATLNALETHGSLFLRQQSVIDRITLREDEILVFPTFLFPTKNFLTYPIAEDTAKKAAMVEVSFFADEFN